MPKPRHLLNWLVGRNVVQATHTIPVVFAQGIDPVGAGYIDSVARPGGNVTGFVQLDYSLAGKWMELLKEIAPEITRVRCCGNRAPRGSAYGPSSSDVERACSHLIAQISRLEIAFFLGQVERGAAPKIMHVPLMTEERNVIEYGTQKLELAHLQYFAYVAALAPAHERLPRPITHVIVDSNKSVIRWFNENRQASRLAELIWANGTKLDWPPVTYGTDTTHTGLQVADILTYYGTKQLFDPRFTRPFDAIRARTQFITYEFAEQTRKPFVAPTGVLVRPIKKRRSRFPVRRGSGSANLNSRPRLWTRVGRQRTAMREAAMAAFAKGWRRE
jgi:hypothetical protein